MPISYAHEHLSKCFHLMLQSSWRMFGVRTWKLCLTSCIVVWSTSLRSHSLAFSRLQRGYKWVACICAHQWTITFFYVSVEILIYDCSVRSFLTVPSLWNFRCQRFSHNRLPSSSLNFLSLFSFHYIHPCTTSILSSLIFPLIFTTPALLLILLISSFWNLFLNKILNVHLHILISVLSICSSYLFYSTCFCPVYFNHLGILLSPVPTHHTALQIPRNVFCKAIWEI